MNQQLSKDHLGLYTNLMSTVGDFKAGLKADIKGMDAQYQMLGQRNADMRDQLIKMKEREKALMQKKAGIQGSIGEAHNANDSLQHVIKKLTQRISKLDQFENDVRGLMRDAENVKGCLTHPGTVMENRRTAPPKDVQTSSANAASFDMAMTKDLRGSSQTRRSRTSPKSMQTKTKGSKVDSTHQPSLTLYETTGFPNPSRIRAALKEKNALNQVAFIEIDVMKLEHRTEEFKAKNPAGTVPVLRTLEGEYLSESTAITEYIDAFFDGPSLTGTTPLERGLIHMMQRRAEFMVMDAVGTYFHHATDGLGPELETNQFPEWGNHQKERALAGLAYFNKVLENNLYVAANMFSMADITLFYGLASAEFISLQIPSELTNLIAWRKTMSQRKCFSTN